jgi:glucosamine 6-phosphate synthetase-like amidotransferase/phosphosugar isomerase protein
LLTLALARSHGRLTDEQEAAHLKALRHLPVALQAVLALEPQVIGWAEQFAAKENALFLGRGLHYPIALEGALKLKEITYIHAEAYAAGELKHGPLALVTSAMPVVVVAPNDALLEKLKSNMQEVRARRRAVRAGRRRQPHRQQRRPARHPHARERRPALAHPARGAAAAPGLSHGGGARHGRGQAAQPGQERDGGVSGVPARSWR